VSRSKPIEVADLEGFSEIDDSVEIEVADLDGSTAPP
jgi:hypothetical protein